MDRSSNKNRLNSDNSRAESAHYKSPHSSLIFGGVRGMNSSIKQSRFGEDSDIKPSFMAKGDSISNSMSRMIRSSPKIHLKQHIGNQGASSTLPKKNAGLSKNFQNKLHLNRYAFEKGVLNGDSSRNQKLEGLIQKHILHPLRTSSGNPNRSKCISSNLIGSYNQSSVIGNSLSYTNEGRRKINYISPKINSDDISSLR